MLYPFPSRQCSPTYGFATVLQLTLSFFIGLAHFQLVFSWSLPVFYLVKSLNLGSTCTCYSFKVGLSENWLENTLHQTDDSQRQPKGSKGGQDSNVKSEKSTFKYRGNKVTRLSPLLFSSTLQSRGKHSFCCLMLFAVHSQLNVLTWTLYVYPESSLSHIHKTGLLKTTNDNTLIMRRRPQHFICKSNLEGRKCGGGEEGHRRGEYVKGKLQSKCKNRDIKNFIQ